MSKLKLKSHFLLAFLLVVSFLNAQSYPPLKTNDFCELRDNKNEILYKNLKKELEKNSKWKHLLDSKNMCIAVVDLSDTNNIKYAGINDDHMIYSASLPKIAILYAVMHAVEAGEIKYTESVQNDLKLMIAKSNNAAATRMIDLVGYEKIEDVLQNSGIPLYDKKTGGGLWVGKRYASKGRRYPEPIKGISHAATAYQAANFYYLLALGKLINYNRSAQMLDVLKDPDLHHKLVNTLDNIAPDATIYRKSGTWKFFHADSVLVWGPNRRYILVVLIKDSQGEQIIRNLVVPVEKVIKSSA